LKNLVAFMAEIEDNEIVALVNAEIVEEKNTRTALVKEIEKLESEL
jgi:succinate dehydrogenase flavin-adding protein (antitoxin of CptAB toxin-antitoxin module)